MNFTKSDKIFRRQILYIFYLGLSILILYRYFFLQVIQNEKFEKKAGNNSLRKIILYPPRGIIYDRNYLPLVDNNPLYQMKIISKDMQENFDFEILEKHTGVNKSYIDSVIAGSKKIPGGQFKPFLLKNYISINTKSILEEYKLDLKGLYFSQLPARIYTSDCDLSHVIGFLKKVNKNFIENNNYHPDDVIGYTGVEKQYEKNLHGSYGIDYLLVDRLGVVQGNFKTDNDISPVQGDDLVLTIDSKIQSFSERVFKDFKGSVLVMNPENGEILSMLSNPNYDLDSFIGRLSINEWNRLQDNKDKPFLNRSIQSNYPPGSIFKLVLSALALEKNIINENWTVECSGEYQFHDTAFRCWKEDGHGNVNLNTAIRSSCNIFFYNLMQEINFDEWYDASTEFGFGLKTGIDLGPENSGLVPNRKFMNKFYKNKGGWSKGHLLNLSIGQGEVSVTPIQVMQLINSIANNGLIYEPHLNINLEKKYRKIDYKNKVWKILNNAMYDAVNSNGGTAYNTRISPEYGIAYGKTGTAQVCGNCEIEPHGWFAGYLELNNKKKFSICVIIENGGKGSVVPTQIAKKIFDYIIGLENV